MSRRPLQRAWIPAILLVLGAAGAAQAAAGGSISGRVVFAGDGAVAGATVILHGETGPLLTSTADPQGVFHFENLPPGPYRLEAAALGFSPVVQDLMLSAGEQREVEITLPLVVTERVMVIGDASRVRDIPGSAYLIDEHELITLKLGHDDVHTFLRRVPGVNLQDEEGYGLRPNIGMRGTGSDRSSKITLMEDGVLIAPAPYAAPSAYYFPTAGRMEALEVRKGSSQIRYGPRTNGGVLNLISTAIPREFRLRTSMSVGEDNTRKITANFGTSYRNFGWLVETYQVENDGFKHLDGRGNTGFDVEDYLAKVRLNTTPDERIYQEVEVKLGKTDQVANETYLGLTDADFERTPFRRYAASQEDVFRSAHEQYQARHLLAVPKFDLTTVVYRNNFHRNWFKLQSISDTSLASILSNPRDFAEQLNIARGADSAADALAVRHNDRQYYGAGVQSVLGVPMTAGAARHQFEIGVRYHEDEEDRFQREDDFAMINGRMVLTTLGAPASQANRVSHAGALATFVQDTIRWDRWSLTAGFRYENIDLTRTDYATTDPDRTSPARIRKNAVDVLIPGFGVNFAMSPAIGLFGGVHKGFSPPGPGSAEDTGAEASVNYEFGMRAQGHALNAEVVAFFNDYDNLLGRDTLAAGGTGEGDQFNGGEARVFGLEASASWNLEAVVPLRSSLPVQVAYTFTDAEFRNAFSSTFGPWGNVAVGDGLPYIPTHQLYGSIGVDEPGWRVQLEGIYVDQMRTQAGQGPIGRAESTDSYLIFNASGEYELAPGTSLFASMQNLTNRKYIVARRPAGARPGLPRLLLAGIKFDLGR